jgi:hypothetical protein
MRSKGNKSNKSNKSNKLFNMRGGDDDEGMNGGGVGCLVFGGAFVACYIINGVRFHFKNTAFKDELDVVRSNLVATTPSKKEQYDTEYDEYVDDWKAYRDHCGTGSGCLLKNDSLREHVNKLHTFVENFGWYCIILIGFLGCAAFA